ncbi:MAG: hypothetical protein IPI44_01585 [Sulfuritalea sp.]|nr:hypothetical protein [Sulfuritalea sp.]
MSAEFKDANNGQDHCSHCKAHQRIAKLLNVAERAAGDVVRQDDIDKEIESVSQGIRESVHVQLQEQV